MISKSMLKFKTKVSERGQIVIPKILRENLGITKNKLVFIELQDKTLRLTLAEERDIVISWKEISKKEGGNISKEFIYGDSLYEEAF